MEGIWFDGRYINPTKPDGITRLLKGWQDVGLYP